MIESHVLNAFLVIYLRMDPMSCTALSPDELNITCSLTTLRSIVYTNEWFRCDAERTYRIKVRK